MHRYDPGRQRLALGLAFLAGQVDSTGFVVAGGYFTSFMSGNTTRLGVDLATAPELALLPLTIIACFVGGVTLGAMIAVRYAGRHKRILLGVVTLLLGAAGLALHLSRDTLFMALAATAMGVSNNVFSRDGEVTVGVTYMTGALVRSGQGIAARLLGRPNAAMRGYAMLWLALALGAVGGAMLHARAPDIAASLPFALAGMLFLCALRIEGRAA